MYRLLLIDVEGLLRADSSASPPGVAPWLPWLVDVLRPHEDVRIVLDSAKERQEKAPGRDLLGDLAPRVLGTTHGLPRVDALEAAIRTVEGRVKHHLLVVASAEGLPSGRFDLLVCDSGLGLSAPKAHAALEAWLLRGANEVYD